MLEKVLQGKDLGLAVGCVRNCTVRLKNVSKGDDGTPKTKISKETYRKHVAKKSS